MGVLLVLAGWASLMAVVFMSSFDH